MRRRTFAGLMSLCTINRSCRNFTAETSCRAYLAASASSTALPPCRPYTHKEDANVKHFVSADRLSASVLVRASGGGHETHKSEERFCEVLACILPWLPQQLATTATAGYMVSWYEQYIPLSSLDGSLNRSRHRPAFTRGSCVR